VRAHPDIPYMTSLHRHPRNRNSRIDGMIVPKKDLDVNNQCIQNFENK
jgi:hypothetical protein